MKKSILLFSMLIILFSCSSKPEEQEKKSNLSSSANDFMNQGNKQFRDGLFKVSISSFEKALGIYSGLNDTEGIITALLAQGKTYLALQAWDDALKILNYAEEFAKASGDQILYRSALNALTEYYLKDENLDKALELCDHNLTPDIPMNHEETALMFRLRGTIFKRQGNLDIAEKDLKIALGINETILNHGDAAAEYTDARR